ncbi:AmmeMemoRadiSam system protein B, partial [bacterium]
MTPPRPAVLAGAWYPADPDELADLVDGWFSGGSPRTTPPAGRPLIVVAPHAGFAYSGATAGLAHSVLRAHGARRVVIMAPNHRTALDRIALSGADSFTTPLGRVPVDRQAVAHLAASPAFV